jgi:DNA-binding NarL/FixJ family response regulator
MSRLTAINITPRDQEVLRLLSEGLSNKEIGARMGICERTVKAHLWKLFIRTGCKNRITLAAEYTRTVREFPILAS